MVSVFARAVCANCYTATAESVARGAAGLRMVVAKAKAGGWIVRDGEMFCTERCAQENADLLKRIRERHSLTARAEVV